MRKTKRIAGLEHRRGSDLFTGSGSVDIDIDEVVLSGPYETGFEGGECMYAVFLTYLAGPMLPLTSSKVVRA